MTERHESSNMCSPHPEPALAAVVVTLFDLIWEPDRAARFGTWSWRFGCNPQRRSHVHKGDAGHGRGKIESDFMLEESGFDAKPGDPPTPRSAKRRRRLDPVQGIQVGGLISDGQIRTAGAGSPAGTTESTTSCRSNDKLASRYLAIANKNNRGPLLAVDLRGRVWQERREHDGGLWSFRDQIAQWAAPKAEKNIRPELQLIPLYTPICRNVAGRRFLQCSFVFVHQLFSVRSQTFLGARRVDTEDRWLLRGADEAEHLLVLSQGLDLAEKRHNSKPAKRLQRDTSKLQCVEDSNGTAQHELFEYSVPRPRYWWSGWTKAPTVSTQ